GGRALLGAALRGTTGARSRLHSARARGLPGGARAHRASPARQHVVGHHPVRARGDVAGRDSGSRRVGGDDRARPGFRRRGRAAALVMRREETAREFLDGPAAPPDLAASLDDIDRLNAWFGGYALTLREIRRAAAAAGSAFIVVDVGGGRGDLAVRVA